MTTERVGMRTGESVAETVERSKQATRRVALLGPYASRNLGDTATQMAVIANLLDRRADLQIVGVSPNPADTLASLGVPAFPLSGRGPASGTLSAEFPESRSAIGHAGLLIWPAIAFRIARFVRSLDLLIVSGGGQLDDYWGGARGHPLSMLLWTLLARLQRVPVIYLAVGLDRLDAPWSRRFALTALKLANRRSFRDATSREAIQRLGLNADSSVCPDLAFSLPVHFETEGPPRRRFAVINPISQKTWAHKVDSRQDAYLEQLADVGAWIAQQGLLLRIVCSQPTMDTADAQRLMDQLRARGVETIEFCPTPRVVDYIDRVRGADVLIGARLHGVILGIVAGTPVVALAPLPKVESVMADLGLSDLCLPLQDFQTSDLIARVANVLAHADEFRAHIQSENTRLRKELMKTFDEVVAMIVPTR